MTLDDSVPATASGPEAPDVARARAEKWFCVLVFIVAVAVGFHFTTINWKMGFLAGHEFRQVQTALISHYIDLENNFSPFYNQPIFGKPWSVQLEFPLYEWAVVGLSRWTHWPHFLSARTLSLGSFYLTLGALHVVLGHVGLPWPRRLLVLALVVATPSYLFYSRAFLIDPMALMFSVWFVALFLETMRRRHWLALVGCMFCGTAAALIKSLVFFAWLLPAAASGAWMLARVAAGREGVAATVRTLAWGLSTVALPCAALAWWVPVTDAIKAAHPNAFFLTSHNLVQGNYGAFSLAARTSGAVWRELLARWDQAFAAPWAVLGIVVFGVVLLRRERWRVVAAAALFLAPQLAIPHAYAGQDYYYYTCAAFAAVAFGFVAVGLLDLPGPRALWWPLVLLLFVPLADSYRRTYLTWQSGRSDGGTQLAFALRDVLPPESVIVVAGADWAAMLPYYARHRALMLRNGLESRIEYVEPVFQALADEHVSALVLIGAQRGNQALVQRAAEIFGTDTAVSFSGDETDVYLDRLAGAEILGTRLKADNPYGVTLGPGSDAGRPIDCSRAPPARMRAAFPMVSPAPSAFRSQHGYGIWRWPEGTVLSAHPDLDLRVPVPAGAGTLEWEFGILPGAWEGRGGAGTNGVEFIVELEDEQGGTRPVFQRLLAPATVERDRGPQREAMAFQARPGESLAFRTRAHEGNDAFDWAFWRSIRVH